MNMIASRFKVNALPAKATITAAFMVTHHWILEPRIQLHRFSQAEKCNSRKELDDAI
jgi:hypothetical protein